ncbi:zinc finger protein [Gracilaria domingensis]|nr:zinc finger protein [Gracilaria domingensis]
MNHENRNSHPGSGDRKRPLQGQDHNRSQRQRQASSNRPTPSPELPSFAEVVRRAENINMRTPASTARLTSWGTFSSDASPFVLPSVTSLMDEANRTESSGTNSGRTSNLPAPSSRPQNHAASRPPRAPKPPGSPDLATPVLVSPASAPSRAGRGRVAGSSDGGGGRSRASGQAGGAARKEKCPKCSLRISGPMNSHTCETLTCDKCDYTTVRTSNLRRHVYLRHIGTSGEAGRSDSHAGGSGSTSGDVAASSSRRRCTRCSLYVSGAMHSHKCKIWTCPVENCGFTTVRQANLRRHESALHAEGTRPQFRCPDCGKIFNRKDNMDQHMLLSCRGKR